MNFITSRKEALDVLENYLEKSTTEKCESCWFTTIVSPPVNIGDAI